MTHISMQNIAVMSVQYWHYSFDYFLDSMERCQIKNIELWAGAPHYCFDDHQTRGEANRKIAMMRRKIEDRGMKVIMLTPEQLNYPINLAGHEDGYRRKSLDYFFRYMDDALEFGTDRLFVTSGWGLLDEPREDAWKRSVDSMQILCDRAKQTGVKLVLEQLQPYESNLVTTAVDMQRLLAEVGSDALFCCVDIVAMAVAGDMLESFLIPLGNRVNHIHFADGNPSGHYVWGDGNLPMMEYIYTLETHQYSEYLTLEINDSIYWTDPHQSIARTASYLRRFLPED